MAKILIHTMPAAGHVNPVLPLAKCLTDRSHSVGWFTGHSFQEKVEKTGAVFYRMNDKWDNAMENFDTVFPEASSLTGLKRLKFAIKKVFIDATIEQVDDLIHILEKFPADLILADTSAAGSALSVNDKGGPVWATISITPMSLKSIDTAPFGMGLMPNSSFFGRMRNYILYKLFDHILFKDVTDYAFMARQEVNLPPLNQSVLDVPLSPYLFLQTTVPSFEYMRSDLPPQVHFVGPLLPDPPKHFEPPAWWSDLEGDYPVVHVTQGTFNTDPAQLIIPTIKALAKEDLLVVATLGGKAEELQKLPSLPQNVRVESFIPHSYLLPHTDVMITNAGYGGVQMALAHGVPLVAAGVTEEKFEVACRIEWAGVGINLKTNNPTEHQIKTAVKKILQDKQYATKAGKIQKEIAGYPSAQRAAQLIETLIDTEKPVLTSE